MNHGKKKIYAEYGTNFTENDVLDEKLSDLCNDILLADIKTQTLMPQILEYITQNEGAWRRNSQNVVFYPFTGMAIIDLLSIFGIAIVALPAGIVTVGYMEEPDGEKGDKNVIQRRQGI